MLLLTKKALEEFDNQHDFERMCADILNGLGCKDVVLIAPRGGGMEDEILLLLLRTEAKDLRVQHYVMTATKNLMRILPNGEKGIIKNITFLRTNT